LQFCYLSPRHIGITTLADKPQNWYSHGLGLFGPLADIAVGINQDGSRRFMGEFILEIPEDHMVTCSSTTHRLDLLEFLLGGERFRVGDFSIEEGNLTGKACLPHGISDFQQDFRKLFIGDGT